MSTFSFFKVIPLLFLTTVFLLGGCNNFAENTDFSLFTTENVLITLPEYPSDNYPTLSGWLVKTRLNGKEKYQYLDTNTKNTFVTLQKNKANPVLIWPIISTNTKTENTIFFYPAGCIYPYSTKAKWNAGFSAHIFDTLLEHNCETTSTQNFLSRFNWNKLQISIEEKEIKAQTKGQVFNPWWLNQEILLNTISSGKFSAHQLKEKDKTIVQINMENKSSKVYSKYIPLNITTHQTDKNLYFNTFITLSKDKYTINPENQFLQDNFTFGIIIANKKHKPRLVRTELQRYTKRDESE